MYVRRKEISDVMHLQTEKKTPNIRIEVHIKKGIEMAAVEKKIRESAREIRRLTGEKRIGISMNAL